VVSVIHINGGVFTNREGISDLAHAVSEEIMHSTRMQGGLWFWPQM
jgi:hypothetical protein